MPVGDITGWRQIFTDDFTVDVPSGAGVAAGGQAGYFPQAVSSKWKAYPYPWSGTPTWGTYFPERVTSIHGGVMDMWLHTETIGGVSKHLITANEPLVNGAGQARYLSSGRYVARYKVDQFPSYHISWLLWPQADDTGTQHWPGSGEIDFPEGDTNQDDTRGYVHYQDGTSGGDQRECVAPTPVYGAWHTAVIEWSSGAFVRFLLDGTLVCEVTSRVPVSPMRWVIQNGGSWGGTAADATNGHVLLDWVAVYTATGA